MKYTSILAGVLGLMALAACNDEVAVVEQPNVVRTLTVTWGGGADTRLSMSNTSEGLKTSWAEGDEIAVLPMESETIFIYRAAGSGQTAVFNLIGETGPKSGAECFIIYPSTFNTGLDLSNQTGLLKNQQNYIVAGGTATFTDNNLDNKVTLQPETSYLYIPAGTAFPLLNTIDGLIYDDATIVFSADDLITGINTEGQVYGDITIDAGTTALLTKTSDAVEAAVDIYIAVPVSINAITDMTLDVVVPKTSGAIFHGLYGIVVGAGSSSAASISNAGHVYTITSDNLYPVED